jgi:hypothetical protein
MEIWNQWSFLQFLCYTGIIILISSTLTAEYMRRNQGQIKDVEKDLNKSKMVTAWKLKGKPWWCIRFHRPGTIPDEAEKRIFPPLHPGGPVEKEIDTFIISKMREGMTIKQAWDEALKNNFYPENAIKDNVYMRGEYNNMKKRVKKRYSKSSDK